MSVRSNSAHEFFLPDRFPINKCFQRCSAAALFTLMGALIIVVIKPFVQICLYLFERVIYFSAQSWLIKLLQNRLVKALANTIGLRMARLDSCMFNVVYSQIQLVVMPLDPFQYSVPRSVRIRNTGRSCSE